MKIIFMGTPDFAVPSLKILLENNYEIVGVVTAPDKPAGRGLQLHQSAIKKLAVEKRLAILQPEKLKDSLFIQQLKSLNADLQIVVAFRMLPEEVWNMPPLGTYNLHASLLPKYRGAAPINWAIINGDSESGATTFKLKHEIDTGHILHQQKVNIGERMTAGELHDELMIRGAALLLKSVNEIKKCLEVGTGPVFISQDNSEASHAPKLFKNLCNINWNNNANVIYNLVRGLSPYPAAFSTIQNNGIKQSIKIFKCEKEILEHSLTSGFAVCDGRETLKVSCGNGFIHLKEIQLEGKKRMKVDEFLRGYKLSNDAQFE
jgi:methionyl-tRNA formyltransferase